MKTGQASTATAPFGSGLTWASWLAALVGLWVLVSLFVLNWAIMRGIAIWSTAKAEISILLLAGDDASAIRTSAEGADATGEWSGWIAALAGIRIFVSPFALSGEITASPATGSTLAGGVVVRVLAADAGSVLHSGE